jgi:hypothetical protein
MGLSTKTSTTEPWKAAQPYILGGANTLNNAYSANAPGLQSATDQITGLLPNMLDKYRAGDSGIDAARSYNTDVLSGRYLNQGNPEFEAMLQGSNDDIRNQAQAAMGARGLTGGSNYADIISRNIGRNSSAMRYQNYGDERSRMATAAGQSPGIAAGDAARTAPLIDILGAYGAPMNAAGNYAGSLGGLLGGYQKQSQNPSTADGIGKALSIAALFSDERLKTDIRRVGQTDSGQPVYTYRYKAGGPVMMGVMAQETPAEALGPVVGGFMTVNYGEVR